MSTTLSLVSRFKEKLLAGKYTQEDLYSIKIALEKNTDLTSVSKLKILNQYYAGELKQEPIKVDHKDIKLNTEVELIEEPQDLTDFSVAKKYIQIHDSAKRRGLEFTLSLADVKSLMKKTKCHYTGIKYDYSDPEKSPSFDRVDYKLGYVKGNVVSCRRDVNQLKNILIEHPVSVFKDNPKLLKKVVDKWIV